MLGDELWRGLGVVLGLGEKGRKAGYLKI